MKHIKKVQIRNKGVMWKMDSWILAKDRVGKRTVFDFRNALDAGIILSVINFITLFSVVRRQIFYFILLFYMFPLFNYYLLFNKAIKFNKLVEKGRLIICQIEKKSICYKAMYRSKIRTMYCKWFEPERKETLLFRADNMIYYLNGQNRAGEKIDEISHVYVMYDVDDPKKYYVFHDELIVESSTCLESVSSSELPRLLFLVNIILFVIVCGVIWINRRNIMFL